MTVAATRGALDPQGPVAESMADLWWLMLVLGVVVFAVFAALLAAGLLRRRRSDEPAEVGDDTSLVRRWVVPGGVVLPTVVVAVVFAATVAVMRDVPVTAPEGALDVHLVGHQWWWEVHYPEEGVTTANELHLPVGRPVALRLTSADVIHSFWVPELGGKMDALPDGVNTLVLEADEPGEHISHCAEFCGLQHALMRVAVVAEPQERFDAWLAGLDEPAARPAAADARRGLDVFLAAGCGDCHVVRGTSADGTSGPELTHVAARPTIGAGAAPNTPAHLAEWVLDPHAVKEGVDMPATDLTDEQVDDLLAYLGTLE